MLMIDAGVKRPSDLFVDPQILVKPSFDETIQAHTAICRELLVRGRNARGDLRPEIRAKLKPNYLLELRRDPWGHDLTFSLGPLEGPVNRLPFRIYRGENCVYDHAMYEKESAATRGLPEPEADVPPGKGFPAPADLPVYIFSCGLNGKPDQLPWGGDGGDDINNWDTNSGWLEFYNK